MSEYNRMVGMSLAELLVYETQVMMAVERKDDPRLQPGFPFYGRHFGNKARVVRYDQTTDTLEVEIFHGTNGSSFFESHWDVGYYLHGFDDSSYLPLKLMEIEPAYCVVDPIIQAHGRNHQNNL